MLRTWSDSGTPTNYNMKAMLLQLNEHTVIQPSDIIAVLKYEHNLHLSYCAFAKIDGIGLFQIPLTEDQARDAIKTLKEIFPLK